MYDKSYINDNTMDYKYLHDPESYKLLPKHHGRLGRPFFVKPFYARQEDFNAKAGARTWLIRIFGSLILMKVGYEFGVWDGDFVNKQLRKSVVVEFESEE